jgi:hypothetical protein
MLKHTYRPAPKHVALSELGPDEHFVSIDAYEESNDTFKIEVHDASPAAGLVDFWCPGILLPFLVGEYGEPDELLGRRFIATRQVA